MTEDEAFDKAVGQFRLAMNSIMHPLRQYGQGYYVDTASEELVSLSLQLHNKLCGIDEPYHINHDKLNY